MADTSSIVDTLSWLSPEDFSLLVGQVEDLRRAREARVAEARSKPPRRRKRRRGDAEDDGAAAPDLDGSGTNDEQPSPQPVVAPPAPPAPGAPEILAMSD